jgi:hypothetical protein
MLASGLFSSNPVNNERTDLKTIMINKDVIIFRHEAGFFITPTLTR